MTNQTLANQTKTNNVNTREVSHVTVVTNVQPLSIGARLRLAHLSCA